MFLVLNWKMNPETLEQALDLFESIKKAAAKMSGKTIVAPPALFLRSISEKYKGKFISFAIQNIHTEKTGAFTGEISAAQAKSVGCEFVLVGHFERRVIGEDDDDVRKKVSAALDSGLSPIICIGEKVRDPHSGEHLEYIKRQITNTLSEVTTLQAKKIIIAYEPVWAIGATEPMKAPQMHEMTIFIRKILWEKYDKLALKIPILYGGAILDDVHATNMVKESEVNGFLLGRASIDSERLHVLISSLSKI